MAETFRRGKIEFYVQQLRMRRAVLQKQLEQKEFETAELYITGQISAVDTIIQELATEFDVEFPERVRLGEPND
jgi:hypothetical protein